MAFTSTHEIGKARELIAQIESIIGFDEKTGLVKAARLLDDPDASHLDTFENISLAINYALLGNTERAKNILIAIEKYVGKDNKTGLFFNKLGIGQHEEKKVLPGEKTIYLSNQVLIFLLLLLLGESKKARDFLEIIKDKFQFFSFNNHSVYQHALNLSSFYAFNNLFMAIAENVASNQEKSMNLVNDILDLCWDHRIGLLTFAPNEKLYFILDNSLLAIWYKLNNEGNKCRDIIKIIEEKVKRDNETKLFYRGVKLISDNFESIPPALTYTNSVLSIAYLVSADLFTKN
ncbi:MAG: hypothetical protein Q8Q95_04655 [bacterium]|nr:hypothetical protein [bacterium]